MKWRLDDSEWVDAARIIGNMAGNIPELRREVMQGVSADARQAFLATYTQDLPLDNAGPNHKEPTMYRGTLGQSLRIFITPQGTLTLTLSAPHADKVERGGSVSAGERDDLETWARTKIGLQTRGQINRLIRSINRKGVAARNLMRDALDPSTPRGSGLQQNIRFKLQQGIDRYALAHGFRRGG